MTRMIAYHAPQPLPFGDRFEATMIDRRLEIGFGSKRFHFAMRSSRFHRSTHPDGSGQGGSMLWRAMGYIGCASLALGLVFVSGSMLRASPPIDPYAVVLPIASKAAPAAPKHRAKPRSLVRARTTGPVAAGMNRNEDWSVAPPSDADDAATGIARPAPDVATLPTVNGERAVAVYGPTRIVGGKSCRDVNVFVRDVDGKVSASPTTECKPR